MKKKILSLALACLMIMTAIVTAIPVFADTFTTDAAAVEGGMVCRIGEEGTGTYYSDFKTAYSAVAVSGGTITLIDDVSITGKTSFKNSNSKDKKITITGGKEHTLSFENGGFVIDSANTEFIIENLTLKRYLSVYNPDAFMQCRYNSSMTFNNVDFVLETVSGVTVNNLTYLFRTQGTSGATNTITLNNCSVTGNVVAKGDDGCNFVLFGAHNSYLGIQNMVLNNVKVDIKGDHVNAIGGFNYDHSTSAPQNAANIGTFTLKGNTTVSVDGDAVVRMGLYTINIEDTASLNTTANMFASGAKSACKYVNVNVTSTATTPFGTYTAPTLEAGASVRTTEGSNGLRFTANYTGNAAEYGIIAAATADTLTSSTFTTALGSSKYVKAASTDDDFKMADDGSTYNIVLKGAVTTNSYSARAYATYNIGNGVTVTVYSAYTEADNARTMKYVATAALADVKTEAELQEMDSAEAAKYMCKITDDGATKYSRYSEAQREVLAAIAA